MFFNNIFRNFRVLEIIYWFRVDPKERLSGVLMWVEGSSTRGSGNHDPHEHTKLSLSRGT